MYRREYIWIVLLVCILASCAPQQRVGPTLLLNLSNSASELYVPEAARTLVNRVIIMSHPGPLTVRVTAKHPITLHYANTTRLTFEQIMEDIYAERDRQRRFEEMNAQDLNLPPRADTPDAPDLWGWGTDHGIVLRRIATDRPPGTSLLIVALSDGRNESFPWEDVEAGLQALYADTGPTWFLMVGVSQQILDDDQTTVLYRWRRMLTETGAADLANQPATERGFFLSSRVELPTELLRPPPRPSKALAVLTERLHPKGGENNDLDH